MASKDMAIAAIMEQLMAEGPQAMAPVVTALMNLAMRMEREQIFGAGHYERSSGRRGYATAPSLKRSIRRPNANPGGAQDGGPTKPFFPQSLERGRRACRAVMLCAAEMYVKGVSTRAVEKVLAEFGIEGLSSTQVSRAAALLDDELEAWRDRPFGCFRYLFLDTRYEKTREHGVPGDYAVLSAIGIEPSGKRRILGLSVAFPRPRCTGALSWKAWWRAACKALSSSPRTIIPASRPPAKPCCPAPAGSMRIPPRPERHPPRSQSGHSQGHRRRAPRHLGCPKPGKRGGGA